MKINPDKINVNKDSFEERILNELKEIKDFLKQIADFLEFSKYIKNPKNKQFYYLY